MKITRFADARVFWTDNDIETFQGEVELLPNGWIRLPETDAYYPPHEVKEVLN